MNWKKQPNLFANGKFKMNIKVNGNDKILDIYGAIAGKNGDWSFIPVSSDFSYWVDEVKLVAQQISDMSREEMLNCPTFKKMDITPEDELIHRLNMWSDYYFRDMPAVVQNYLLSIGVYPFDQSDFKSDDLIDITKTG